jgi:hypothetical protein
MDELEKTDWYDGDQAPEHDGIYEWENPSELFEGPVVPEWRTRHWIVTWKTSLASGQVICTEAPCRWRGLANPPVENLLEI